jgi:membrane protease YdiL (CAAX protease family)
MGRKLSIARVWIVWATFLLSCFLVIPFQNPLVRIPVEIVAYSLPLFVVWVFVRKQGFWKSIRMKRKNIGKSISISLALLLVFSLLIEGTNLVVLHFMGKSQEEVKREIENYLEKQTPQWYPKYLLVGSFFPIAFCEEAVFRGFVLWTLISFGPVASILTSSFLHAFLHLWYLHMGVAPLLFTQALLLFISFGIAGYLSENITGPILMHGFIDFLSVLGYFNQEIADAIQAALFFLGAFCLFGLLLSHMRARLERRIQREIQARVELNLSRLEQMRDGLRKMLAEIRRRYRRGRMSKQDFLRLKATYERRIREVERILNLQKEPTKSTRA